MKDADSWGVVRHESMGGDAKLLAYKYKKLFMI